LNRPELLNAFNEDMHRRLAAALDEIAADEACRAVLSPAPAGVSARGRIFPTGSAPMGCPISRRHYRGFLQSADPSHPHAA
jgi:hypothetical protein